MFGLSDIPKFVLAFFIVLPLISFLHESGHVFFAWLMGAKNIKVTVGTGRVLFRWGILDVRKYYFWYGVCTFDNLTNKKRWSYILIYSGGILLNALSVLGVIVLTKRGIIEASMITYQFTYFSMYYLFFSLLPMPYPDGNYSDGKIIVDLIRDRKGVVGEKAYLIQSSEDERQWRVLDEKGEVIETFDDEEQALKKGHDVAQKNRPSRLFNRKEGTDVEVQNYPRLPL